MAPIPAIISPSSGDATTTLSTSPNGGKNNRYKQWFRPGQWMKRGSSFGASVTSASEQEGSLNLKQGLVELATVAPVRNSCIALLDLSEIKVAVGTEGRRICDVESIVLADEHTAEYMQQERYRLQLLQESKKKQYSLKQIPHGSSTRSKKIVSRGVRLLIQEAVILSKLGDHPSIITLRGLPSRTCDDFFLLTDRLHKDTLETRIEQWQEEGKSSLPQWDALLEVYGTDDHTAATPDDDMIPRKTNYAFQIAKALQACHKAGIIVRNLSPSSIGFLKEDPHRVQLLDLSHAIDIKSMSSSSWYRSKATIVGKRYYLAAETWKTGKYSFKTDVYSWAMVYYEMCMERKPFQNYSASEHQKYVWDNGERPPLSSDFLPEGIDKVLMEAWAHHPEERLTIDQVCHKTQQLLMHLDACLFWDQAEDDFLFDLCVPTDEDDISELGDELNPELDTEDGQATFMEPDARLTISGDLCAEDGSVFKETSHESSSNPTTKLVSSRESSFISLSSGHQKGSRQVKLVSSAA